MQIKRGGEGSKSVYLTMIRSQLTTSELYERRSLISAITGRTTSPMYSITYINMFTKYESVQ